MKALVICLGLIGSSSFAQYGMGYGSEMTFGNTTYGNYYDGQGNSVNTTRMNIGNNQYETIRDNNGNSRNCTHTRIGNQIMTNCY